MKYLKWLFVILGICGLVSVRIFEDILFYDPFLGYFHEANKNAVFPDFEDTKLILSHFFRFFLNVFFSGMVVYFIFLNKKWAIQAVVLVAIVFVLTFPIYLYCIYTKFEIGYLFSFYIRRFVIQPMILLLIIPLFYYRKHLLAQNLS